MRLYNRRRQKVMEENYVEWLVKRKDPVYAWPVKVLMIVLCALSAFAALQVMFGVCGSRCCDVFCFFKPQCRI